MADWYSVSRRDLKVLGGTALLQRSPLPNFFEEAFPEVSWDPLLFKDKGRLPGGFRRSKDVLLPLLGRIEAKLEIQQVRSLTPPVLLSFPLFHYY